MRRFIIVAFIGFVLVGFAAAWPKESRKIIDIDGDGYKEAEVFYSGREIVKTLVDNDHDKRMETVIYYKHGTREHAEQDLDGNGKIDRVFYYYFTGVPWKVAEDLNHDGKLDYWFYLKYGRIYKWEEDRNADGVADNQTIYDADKADKEKVLAQQSSDNNFDGTFETFSGVTVEKKEAMVPDSLTEALLR